MRPLCSIRTGFLPTRTLARAVLFLALGLGLLGLLNYAQAQTPVTKVKDSNGNVLFQLNEDAGLLVNGDGTGSIPATGAGVRMMWYPDKEAFRAGEVGINSGKEDVWDPSNVGGKSVAFGVDTKASGFHSMAIGNVTSATATNAVAMGKKTMASGSHAVAMGQNTEANALKAVAMGGETLASGNSAVAMGHDTRATQFHAVAMNEGTEAIANNTVAMGTFTTASSANAVSMGYKTEAAGSRSLAIGDNTSATAGNAVATGAKTTASGEHSTAMGGRTTASGFASIAMGQQAKAQGTASTAMGRFTTAKSRASVAIGRWNTVSGDETSWVSTDPLLVAGNGGGSNDRSNALLLQKNGEMTIAGNLTENSDRRLKTDIQEIGPVLDALKNIDPVHFHFKEGTGHPKDQQIGLIAQEVQNQFPELVTKGSDGYLSLAYPKLTAVLLKGLQEQQATINEQETRLDRLKADNETIKERLAAVEAKVSGSSPAEATTGNAWVLALLFGLGLGGGIGLTLRRRSE